MIRLFVDTSVLPQNLNWHGALFKRLSTAVGRKELIVTTSDTVWRERLSKVAGECHEQVVLLLRAAKKLLKNPTFDDNESREKIGEIVAVLKQKEFRDFEEMGHRVLYPLVEACHLVVDPASDQDTRLAWDNYFTHGPPFSSFKNRNDIPDSVIYQAVKRMLEKHGELHCVINDKNLRKHVTALDGCVTYEGFEAFFASDHGKVLGVDASQQQWWTENWNSIADDAKLRGDLEHYTYEALVSLLDGSSIGSGDIPSINGHALVTKVASTSQLAIDWQDKSEMGPGWMAIPYSAMVELELDFLVPRSFLLWERSDWVTVLGDNSEHTLSYQAVGSREFLVRGNVLVKFSDEQLKNQDWKDPEIEVDLRGLSSPPDDQEDGHADVW